jgi:hypothetical protein
MVQLLKHYEGAIRLRSIDEMIRPGLGLELNFSTGL